MKGVLKLKGKVSRSGSLTIQRKKVLEKVDLPPGNVEVIVLTESEEGQEEEIHGISPQRVLETLGGLWADRDDIKDGASYSLELRRQLETRQDRG